MSKRIKFLILLMAIFMIFLTTSVALNRTDEAPKGPNIKLSALHAENLQEIELSPKHTSTEIHGHNSNRNKEPNFYNKLLLSPKFMEYITIGLFLALIFYLVLKKCVDYPKGHKNIQNESQQKTLMMV